MAWWRHTVAANWAINGSCNGLPPVRCQPIAYTSADLLTIMTLRNMHHSNLDKRTKVPLIETHFYPWVSRIAPIPFRPWCLIVYPVCWKFSIVFVRVCLCLAHTLIVDVLVTFKIRWAFMCNAQFVLSSCLCCSNRLLILWWMYHEHDTTYCCRWIF